METVVTKRLRKGDRRAFETLCLELERPLFGYLLRFVKSRADAEDLTQETLLRLYRMAVEGRIRRQNGALRPLVFSIAHNLAIDAMRKAGNTETVTRDETPHASAPVERVLLREQIAQALAELPENQRSALTLREFGELSYDEIAETLNSSRGAVKTWIYRARRRLAELLDRDGQYVGGSRDGL